MLKVIARDSMNDTTLYQARTGFSVVYGLEVTHYNDVVEAFHWYTESIRHSLQCEGLGIMDEELET